MKYVPNQGLASLSVCCQRRLMEDCVHAPCFFNPCIWLARSSYTTYQYHNWLEGAVVELHFELYYWSIGASDNGPNSDTYSADMMQIWVLVPPKPCVVMPMKHKVFWWAIADVSSFTILYFISLTSHPSSHSGLYVFSCMISYYHIPQVSFL